MKPPLLFFFILSFLSLVFGGTLFPWTRIIAFAPFLSVVFQRKELLPSLWMACLCGLCTDLLSYDLHFGIFCFCFTLTTFLTYHLRKYFFEDSLHSIPLYTAVISFVFSAIQFFLIRNHIGLNIQTALFNLAIMPFADAIYGFIWFTCPAVLYCILMKKRQPKK